MKPIQKQRVDEQVYERLLGNIRENTWTPGDKLPSEAQLCEILGVSRVTVRSAIQRLSAVGLVEVRRGKGTYVVDPKDFGDFRGYNQEIDLTEKEFNDITEMREILEPKAAEYFIRRATPEDLENLEKIYLSLSVAMHERDYEKYTHYDFLFHYTIILTAKNDLMVQVAQVLKDQYFRYFRELNKFLLTDKEQSNLADFSGIRECHGDLFQKIREKDTDAAIAITHEILRSNKDSFLQYLKAKDRLIPGSGQAD